MESSDACKRIRSEIRLPTATNIVAHISLVRTSGWVSVYEVFAEALRTRAKTVVAFDDNR
jgi:hypothetical protein